jgi:hypothetical protein
MYHFEAFNVFSAPIKGIFRPVEAEIRGDVPIFLIYLFCAHYTHIGGRILSINFSRMMALFYLKKKFAKVL